MRHRSRTPATLTAIVALAGALVLPAGCISPAGEPTSSQSDPIIGGPPHCEVPAPSPTFTAFATTTPYGDPTASVSVVLSGAGFLHSSCFGEFGGDDVTITYHPVDIFGATIGPMQTLETLSSTGLDADAGPPGTIVAVLDVGCIFGGFVITAVDNTTGTAANDGIGSNVSIIPYFSGPGPVFCPPPPPPPPPPVFR
jgi:hypothetical protein